MCIHEYTTHKHTVRKNFQAPHLFYQWAQHQIQSSVVNHTTLYHILFSERMLPVFDLTIM